MMRMDIGINYRIEASLYYLGVVTRDTLNFGGTRRTSAPELAVVEQYGIVITVRIVLLTGALRRSLIHTHAHTRNLFC
jgi:hypothetical protein